MTIEKKFLAELPRCYATASIVIDGENTVLLATEGEGACLAFSGKDFDRMRRVWDGPGGTMSMVPIPGRQGEFLAIQKFFKLFQWDEAILVWVKPGSGGGFSVRQILRLPYIHRFDLFEVDGSIFFLGCTLAEGKESRDDWSKAGKLYVGELGGDWDRPLELRVLKDGLFRNHGYSRSTWKGRYAGLVTSDEGAFAVSPPSARGGEWTVERFMDWPISDIAACDIDGDGELEYATIEPWHGQYFRVYKRRGGAFQRIYEHPEIAEFYHVVVGTELRGRPLIIGGCRRGSQHLFYLQATSGDPLSLEAVTIEDGVGPSNVAVLHEEDRDVIISANREKGEAALYFVRD
ncbi:MAG: hypothetical protein WCL50_03840 [Spirochaetota bacterium]